MKSLQPGNSRAEEDKAPLPDSVQTWLDNIPQDALPYQQAGRLSDLCLHFVRLAVSSYSGHLTLERDAITQMKNVQLQQVPGENVTEFTRLFLELADIQ